MYKLFLTAALIAVTLNGHSQKTETRDIESFDKISAFGSLEIYLEKGNKESLKLESETVDLNDITVKSEGKTLKISVTEKILSSHREVKVTITYKELRGIIIKGGAEIFDTTEISGDKLEIIAGSGSTLNLKLNLNTLQISVGQGADVTFEGKCKSQEIETSTGGLYNAYYLNCDSTYVKSNTGGLAKVSAIEYLNASASTGGQISYKGEPKIKKENTSLGGSIEKVQE